MNYNKNIVNDIIGWNTIIWGQSLKFFDENTNLQKKGITDLGVNEKIKKTTDIIISPTNLKDPKYFLFNDYFKKLYECFVDYKKQYEFINTFLKKAHIGNFNIQKYSSGDHFSQLHSERTGISNLHRIFAWMTYLNDVEDGGTTDFDYYGIKIDSINNQRVEVKWVKKNKEGSVYILQNEK